MARKNLLKGLMEAPAPQSDAGRVDAARPRYKGGAIGAVSQSIAELKARSIHAIAPELIDDGGLADRIGSDPEAHTALVQSIRDYGLQVPVLLRPVPGQDGRFEVVYGRRRVAALRELGLPVKAMIRDLDDTGLVIAQGQENSARKDLSFIERASFARQMREAGYDRKVICAALHVDKTVISRMLSVADRVPADVIQAIGAAPGVGRDRWLELADQIEAHSGPLPQTADLFTPGQAGDVRVARMIATLRGKPVVARAAKPAARVVTDGAGVPLAEARKQGKATVLKVSAGDGFQDWLVENLSEIHRDWTTRRDG